MLHVGSPEEESEETGLEVPCISLRSKTPAHQEARSLLQPRGRLPDLCTISPPTFLKASTLQKFCRVCTYIYIYCPM